MKVHNGIIESSQVKLTIFQIHACVMSFTCSILLHDTDIMSYIGWWMLVRFTTVAFQCPPQCTNSQTGNSFDLYNAQ